MLKKIDSYILSFYQKAVDELDMEPKKICTILANIFSVLTLVYVINLWLSDDLIAKKVFSGSLALACIFVLPMFIARIPLSIHPVMGFLRIAFLVLMVFSVINVVTTMEIARFLKDVTFISFIYVGCCNKPTPRKKTKLSLKTTH